MLIREFYKETFYYVLVALGIGVILARLGLPLFNRLADYHCLLILRILGCMFS